MKIFNKEDWLKIGREYGEKGPTTLANEMGVSKQRIFQIVATLRAKGAPIPMRRNPKGISTEVAGILKRELAEKKW